MEHLTLVQCCYDQPSVTERWWDAIRQWPIELQPKVDIIWVDDGSPRHPLRVPDDIRAAWKPRTFRVLEDIPWNEMGARNLAMKHATGWVLCLDADYTLPAESLQHVLSDRCTLLRRVLYYPRARRFGEKKHLHHPINLFFVHSSDFWDAGGYDEQFAGAYGLSDTDLLRSMSHGLRMKFHKMESLWIDHYQMDQNPDSSVQWLNRSLDRNSAKFKAKLQAAQRHGALKIAKQNLHLLFKWEETTCAS